MTLHAWQVTTRPLEQVTLRPAADPPDGRFHVHPLSLIDVPLRRFACPEVDVEHLAGEEDLPSVLRRRWLYDVLEERRAAAAAGDPPPDDAFAHDPPLTIRWRRAPGLIRCCRSRRSAPSPAFLADPASPVPTGWQRPPASIDTIPAGGGDPVAMPIEVAVDPVTGRVAFPDGVAVDHVEVDLADAHVAVLGGGAAARDDDLGPRLAERPIGWQVTVSAHEAAGPWHVRHPGRRGGRLARPARRHRRHDHDR